MDINPDITEASNVQTSKEQIHVDDDFIHKDSDEEDKTMVEYCNIDEEKDQCIKEDVI